MSTSYTATRLYRLLLRYEGGDMTLAQLRRYWQAVLIEGYGR
jgi:hypothetical protein